MGTPQTSLGHRKALLDTDVVESVTSAAHTVALCGRSASMVNLTSAHAYFVPGASILNDTPLSAL